MKLVLDVNVLISGALWNGPTARLITAALRGDVQVFISLGILLELREVLQRPKFAERLAARDETPESLAERFRASLQEAIPAIIMPPPGLRDHDDLAVLACAVGAKADAIVTGDEDLLSLGSFSGIPIIAPAEALMRLGLSGC